MPSGDLIPAARAWNVDVKIEGKRKLSFPAATEQAAKQIVEEMNEYGIWDSFRYYPAGRIEWMEISPDGE